MNSSKRNSMIIALAGDAKSKFLESIRLARQKEMKSSMCYYEEAEKQLSKAILINSKNTSEDIDLVLIHAQNHLMNAILLKDIASELIAFMDGL